MHVLVFLAAIFFIYGYVQNAMKLWLCFWYSLPSGLPEREILLRFVGVFVWPLGWALGFINMQQPEQANRAPRWILHIGKRKS